MSNPNPNPTLKDLLEELLDLAREGVQNREEYNQTQRRIYPDIAKDERAAIGFLQQLADIAEHVSIDSDIEGIQAVHETCDHARLSIHPTDDPSWSTCRWVSAEGTAQETLEVAVTALATGLYCQQANAPYEAAAAKAEKPAP